MYSVQVHYNNIMINFIMLGIIITCIILYVLHTCMHSYFVVNASSYRPFYTQDIGIWWLVGGKTYLCSTAAVRSSVRVYEGLLRADLHIPGACA